MSAAFRFNSYMRRLAYERGRASNTFATAEELRWPGYDRAYRAGARRAEWDAARVRQFIHREHMRDTCGRGDR